jgi:hypothetical protein
MVICVSRWAPELVLCSMVMASCGSTHTQDTCSADDYGSLVGQPLAAVTLPKDLNARIIGPDTVVTMDHRPERLNIEVDGRGTIERLYCG